MLGKALTTAAAGAAAGGAAGAYIEDVFSTWLYTGNDSTNTITNGIDLSGEGGVVWIKQRASSTNHAIIDTERGRDKILSTNTTGGNVTTITGRDLASFNSDGFSLGSEYNANVNYSGSYASWTFRKAEKFFDVVTYTGNGTSGRTVAHNLGSVPGTIIVKKTSGTGNWVVYHRALGASQALYLHTTGAAFSSPSWNSTAPTDTVFSLNNGGDVNGSGATYVAYLFAHDAGGFGDDGTESVIKCGSYTGTGVSGNSVSLGFEPQWLMVKRTDASANWWIADSMRGFVVGGNDDLLAANLSNESLTTLDYFTPTSDGFRLDNIYSQVNFNGGTYIYIAIRRGPMKTPTDATEVFATDTSDATSPSPPQFNAGFPPDAVFRKDVDTTSGTLVSSRLQGTRFMYATSTDAEDTASLLTWDNMYGWSNSSGVDTSLRAWMFRRAPGFFDVVAYTGTGSAQNVSHNLGVAPELMIVKKRNAAVNWVVYNKFNGNNGWLILNADVEFLSGTSMWNNTTPTSTVFSLANSSFTNANGDTYIAYLFATVSGVSKVGSYTGTGTTLDVNCGFTAGARFVLIKRTDSTGDWYVWDTARGIVSGNDPYYRLNVQAAQVTSTDYIDPLSSGFQISSTAPAAINASGGSYIYFSVA